MSSNPVLNPMVLNTVYQTMLDHLSSSYAVLMTYAGHLFYLLAVLELVLFGLLWAFRQESLFGEFIFKVLKLGFIFFLIRSYPSLLQSLIDGFTDVAFKLNSDTATSLFFMPGNIWRYGFDNSLAMLNLSIQAGNTNYGLTLLYLILGFGSLLLFALIGIEVILLTTVFYTVSLLALLLIPFGVFSMTQGFLEKALQSVMSSGAALFALILVLGVGISTWTQFGTITINNTTTIDVLLGFFLMALVIFILCLRVPKYAANAVGFFHSKLRFQTAGSGSESAGVAAAGAAAASSVSATSLGQSSGNSMSLSPAAAVQAAVGTVQGPGGAGQSSVQVNASGSSSATPAQFSAGGGQKTEKGSEMVRHLSPESIKKLKASFKELLKNQDKS